MGTSTYASFSCPFERVTRHGLAKLSDNSLALVFMRS